MLAKNVLWPEDFNDIIGKKKKYRKKKKRKKIVDDDDDGNQKKRQKTSTSSSSSSSTSTIPHQPRQIKPPGTLAFNLDDACIGVEGMKTGFYTVRSMSTRKVDLDRSSPGRQSSLS